MCEWAKPVGELFPALATTKTPWDLCLGIRQHSIAVEAGKCNVDKRAAPESKSNDKYRGHVIPLQQYRKHLKWALNIAT